jgi:hypothetical protein
MSVDEVIGGWSARVKEVTTCLSLWGNSLPPLLEGKTTHEIKGILAREVRSLLERFARTGRWTPTE